MDINEKRIMDIKDKLINDLALENAQLRVSLMESNYVIEAMIEDRKERDTIENDKLQLLDGTPDIDEPVRGGE
jgi:hypothetical protein